MFRPDSNRDRTDYSGILMPPDGYRLDRAVGTTYSLDLEALTAVAICLGLSEETDSKLMQNPIGMLNALQKVSDKIVLFCEAGQIKVPTKPTALSILLEKMVVEVALPKDRQLGRYPAFHPKTWILAYVNAEGDKKYRFVVMSRNLTFDRSWDISFAMDSSKNVRQKKKTQPICDFLDYLVTNVHNTSNNAGKKRNLIRGLCADIKDVSFSLDSKIFGEDFEVLPLGIGKNAYRMQEDILFCKERGNANSTFNELVVMSPFLSESVIADFNLTDRALSDCKRTLVTRRSELGKLKASGDSAIIRMKELAENAMYQGVSRTERISVMDSGDYTDDSSVKHHLQIDENDINSYIQMSRLLSKTDSNHSLPVDYAKSCPYLMSFMKKYKIKEQIEKYYIKHPDEFGSEREQCLLWLNRNKINKYDELPKTNARLEALKEKAFTGGAEKYLWIPPSLPYYEMQGAYKNSKGFSKILVFSAWEMVPRMIGALVSYEAERLTVGKLVHQIKNQDKKNTGYFADGSRRYPVARLRFNVSNGEVRGMSLFALLYPSKTLSDMYLPIESLNNHESLEVIEKSVRLKLKEKLAIIEEKYGDSGNNKEDARWYYLAPMLMDGVIYAKHWIEDIVWEMNTDEEDTTSEVRSSSKDKRNKGFIAHIDKLRSYLDAPEEIHLGRKPEDLLETLVNMVLGSPAICIYRSNGRSTARATSLAKVFVNNFNLPESTAIIDLAYGRCRDDNSHWQNVLKYCKDGCFQAMIDEYIHMLKETAGFQSDGNQYQIVHDMMMDSLKIHTATYIADTYPDFKKRINGADRKSDGCRIRSSYAVGFTKDAGDNSKVVMRKENIRNAFNSPMRPFVLATTSIGQEGLDFHNYCRVIMHWNLPSNPIDVGRILRTFKIKKNVEVTDNGKIII